MVLFKKLILKNFKSHKNTTIEFKNGITILIGDNGAGKSTIFEAISFALFKKYTARKIDNLVRTGINEGESMSVSLEFNKNGEDFIITRTKTKSTTNAEIKRYINGKLETIASGDKNVNKEILEILEIDDDLFLNAIYIRQGEIADLISKTPADRKKLISKLLKVDNLEVAWENILPIITEYEKQSSEIKGKISNSEELKYNLNRRIEDKKILKLEEEKQIKELETLEKQLKENTINLEKQETNKLQYERKQKELETETLLNNKTKKEKQNLKIELEDIKRNKEEMQRLEKYVKKIPIYEEFKDTYYKLKSIQEEKNNLLEKAKEIDKTNNIIKEEKPYYDSYLKVEGELNKLKEEKLNIEKELAQYKQLDIERLNYQQELKNDNAELINFKTEIKTILNDKTDKNLEEYKKLILKEEGIKTQKIQEKELELKKRNNETAILKQKIKETEKDIKEINTIKDECPVCKSQITEEKKEELNLKYQQLIQQAKERIQTVKKEKQNLEINIEKNKTELKKINSINNRFYNYQRINEKIKDNKNKIENLTSKIILKKDKDAQLVSLNKKLQTQEKNHQELHQHYQLYQISQGKIQDMGNENEIKDQLYRIHGQNNKYVEILRNCISQDIFLTEETEITEVNQKLQELNKKKERYDQLKGKILSEESIKTKIDEKTQEVNIKTHSIQTIEKELKNIQYDEIKYQQIKSTNERLKNNYTSIAQNKATITGKLEEIEKTIKDYQERINKNKKLEKDLEKQNQYIEFLKEIRQAFSREGLQKNLREVSRPLIQKYTKNFFEKFNFNYSDLILDEDFNVHIYGPEGESDLDMVSGGEKIAIAIALRLGITQSMGQGNIDTILLDEPTIHLDTYRRHELVDIIRSMNLIPQMIIVTHDSELEAAADNIITVKKENGISTVDAS